MPLYSDSGKINTTVVNGSSFTGLYAADGSINIVVDDASNRGVYHPCGAVRVNSATGSSYYDPTGAVYSNRLFGPGIAT